MQYIHSKHPQRACKVHNLNFLPTDPTKNRLAKASAASWGVQNLFLDHFSSRKSLQQHYTKKMSYISELLRRFKDSLSRRYNKHRRLPQYTGFVQSQNPFYLLS
jgi:hypothetical protein